jgi:hypothetical protein
MKKGCSFFDYWRFLQQFEQMFSTSDGTFVFVVEVLEWVSEVWLGEVCESLCYALGLSSSFGITQRCSVLIRSEVFFDLVTSACVELSMCSSLIRMTAGF